MFNSPLIDWPAQKCRDIQVVQLLFTFGTIGALGVAGVPGQASALLRWLAGNQAGVLLFFKRLIEIDVDRGDGNRANRR